MSFIEKSYGGKTFRPRPEIHVERDNSLLIVATPWGPRSAAKRSIQIIQDYFLSTRQDREATSPFSKLSCLSPIANDLRIAVKLANDSIFNEDNKKEFISGVELFVLAKSESEIVWIQVGYPYALFDRPLRSLTPLGNQQDLALEFSLSHQTLSPLPNKILGLDNSSDFSVESLRQRQQDRLVLISRSGLPPEIYKLSPGERSLESLSQVLTQDDPELPYWIGLFDL